MNASLPKYLVSACLCGKKCRYNGTAGTVDRLCELYKCGQAVIVCPECLGGLKIPRPPAEIQLERVVDACGRDVTAQFRLGAERTLALAGKYGITRAILKERSPSCGSKMIYDGSFSGVKIPGQGITTALLRENGIEVISEEELEVLTK